LDPAVWLKSISGTERATHGFPRGPTTASTTRLFLSPRKCSFVEIGGHIVDPETGDVAVIGFSCVEFGVTVGYHRDAHTAAKANLLELLDEVFS